MAKCIRGTTMIVTDIRWCSDSTVAAVNQRYEVMTEAILDFIKNR